MEEKLVLLAWFNPELVENELIPEIEKNCMEFGMISQTAYNIFQKNKFAENSLYFHHSYAESDIPAGKEFEAIALMDEKGNIQPDSIQKCHAKVLCFFTAFKTRPSACAMRGYHELSLIQFEEDIPPMIYELFEITELKPLMSQKQICLCSETGLWAQKKKQIRYRGKNKEKNANIKFAFFSLKILFFVAVVYQSNLKF